MADVLGLVADRFSLEITFREVKGVVGAGQQQTRFHGANVGAFHVCLWALTATEGWAWRREILGEEIRAAVRSGADEREIHATAERLLDLAA